ncbi:GNAT family N-acetyltransferase [Haladaptatus sp. CMAA 1911]|uniref:GNAT family N-acetyltransferase n=1 Tax=unclassified Haladaptatus TaxID=2622732 RepID=UPI003754CE1C
MVTSELRPARPTDAAAIRRVARRSWHAAYDDIIGADAVDDTIDRWYDPDRLRESTREPTHEFFVAERDHFVGFVHVAPSDEAGTFELLRIYVLPDEWGTGLGTRLLTRVERRLEERNADRLRLVVLADNDVGVGFYESRGFERVEEREDPTLGVREYAYEKEL